MNLRDTQSIWTLGIFLGLTGLVSALILGVFSDLVAEPIRQAELRTINQALRQVLPPFDNAPTEHKLKIKGTLGNELSFMAAVKDGKVAGVACEAVNPRGYAGEITGLIGFNPDGSIRAVLVTKQGETPGLGAEICRRKFQKTIFNLFEPAPEGLPPNRILDQFTGRTAIPGQDWKVKKDGGDVEFVTGSTITCRAVTDLASEAAQTFLANRERIISELGGK